jgi:hypothetical protein
MQVDPEIAFSRGDVMRRLNELEKQVREFTSGRRMENATIGAGGIRVKGSGGVTLQQGGGLTVEDGGDIVIRGGALNVYDDTDTLIAAIGLLPNGARGIAALDPSTGSLVEMSTMAFGTRSVDAEDEEVLGTENVWVSLPGGPVVPNVPIGSSGRALVMVTADISCRPTGSNTEVDAWMGYEITGATTRAPSVYDSVRAAFRRDADTTGNPGITVAASREVLVEGLSQGLHTFEAKYRMSVDTAFDEASYMSRNITVRPF